MLLGRDDLITINNFIKEIQNTYPHFSRDTMRNWKQRHGFVGAAIVEKSDRNDCPTEGYIYVQTIECAKIILDEQEQGRTLEESFKAVDDLILDSLIQINEKRIISTSELPIFKKASFISYKNRLVSMLNLLEEDIISTGASETGKQEKIINDCQRKITDDIKHYFSEIRVNISQEDKSELHDDLNSAVHFFLHWGHSRKNNQIIELAQKIFNSLWEKQQRRKGGLKSEEDYWMEL